MKSKEKNVEKNMNDIGLQNSFAHTLDTLHVYIPVFEALIQPEHKIIEEMQSTKQITH